MKRYLFLLNSSLVVAILSAIIVFWTEPSWAQMLTLNLGEEGGDATAQIIQLVALMTILTLAPSILIMVIVLR